MSPVTHVWRQLVQRRLWPVAILLIAALAAVPLMLAKDPEPTASPPAPTVDTNGELAATPIVAPVTPEDASKRRKVLGVAKNPFATVKPAEPVADGNDGSGPVVVKSPGGGTSGGDSGSGGGSAAPSTTPAAPVAPAIPAEPAPAPRQYEPEELTVRFGGADDAKRRSVERLQPLPSDELPTLIYMGVLKDGKTAEFLLDAGVTAVGDGECMPTPEACETVRLRVGETEFLDVTDENGTVTQQFQLDLLKIHTVKRGSGSTRSMSSVKAKAAKRRSELRSSAGVLAARLP